MRVFIIIIAMLLASGSVAIAQKPAPAQPTQDQAAAEKENPSWYRDVRLQMVWDNLSCLGTEALAHWS